MAETNEDGIVRIDMNDVYRERYADREEAGVVAVFTAFDRDWHLVQRNVFNGPTAAQITSGQFTNEDLIYPLFADGEGELFVAELKKIGSLREDELGDIYKDLVAAASDGRPTKRSSNSKGTSRTRSSGRNSTAASSSPRAGRAASKR